MNQQRIMLLGKNGQVGWELQRSLGPLGHVSAFGSRELDLANSQQLRQEVQRLQPHVIVNAAAYTAVDQAEIETDMARTVNAAAPGVLAEEAKRIGAVLIHYSTNYVFDGDKGEPYTEDDPPNPINVYGWTKLEGEQAIQEAGCLYLILRAGWVYSLRRKSFVTQVLTWSRSQKVMRVVDDQFGSPTWCRMLAEATALALAKDDGEIKNWIESSGGLYHLADEGSVSRFEWAKAILRMDPRAREQSARELDRATTDDFPSPARRPAFSTLDCSRFERFFNIRLPRWEQALELAMAEGEG